MPDPMSIASGAISALSTFKELYEAVKAAHKLVHSADVSAVLIDVQQKLLDHQAACFDLQEKYKAVVAERDAIKKELRDLKQTRAQLESYELKTFAPGFSCYVRKDAATRNGKSEWLCPNCFHDGKVGLLQLSPTDHFSARFFGENKIAHLVCCSCNRNFTLPRDIFEAAFDKCV